MLVRNELLVNSFIYSHILGGSLLVISPLLLFSRGGDHLLLAPLSFTVAFDLLAQESLLWPFPGHFSVVPCFSGIGGPRTWTQCRRITSSTC